MGLVRVGWVNRPTDISPRWGWCVWGGFALPILRPDGADEWCVNVPTDIAPRWGWCVWGGFALPTFRLDGAGACGVGESPYRHFAPMGLVRVGWVNRPTDIAPRWGWCVGWVNRPTDISPRWGWCVGWVNRPTDISPRWGWCVWGGFALPTLRPDGAGACGVVSFYRHCAPMGLANGGAICLTTPIKIIALMGFRK
ncbi:MAG: hypothetical protein KF734_05395 [Saprospiraceae bacterium]|nr:hypothetical protein [Saprospiraceae bacterium]